MIQKLLPDTTEIVALTGADASVSRAFIPFTKVAILLNAFLAVISCQLHQGLV